jgi:hypothetical protein
MRQPTWQEAALYVLLLATTASLEVAVGVVLVGTLLNRRYSSDRAS